MKLYYLSAEVGNYEIHAVGETPEKCIKALVSTYHKEFGSFRENGFKNQEDWLNWHGIIGKESCTEFKLNSAFLN